MKKKKTIIDEGVNGLGIGVVNTNSKEFKELQKIINKESKKQSKKKLLENKLLSLRFRMESYLEKSDNNIIEVGAFLKLFLQELNIKHKNFAHYIGYQESNLSALFKGKRKINPDLALKLGEIFRVDPTLWINIQSKNELDRLKKGNTKEYKKYSIDDLLKKAS